jgi:hypothetical protein
MGKSGEVQRCTCASDASNVDLQTWYKYLAMVHLLSFTSTTIPPLSRPISSLILSTVLPRSPQRPFNILTLLRTVYLVSIVATNACHQPLQVASTSMELREKCRLASSWLS